MIEKYISGIEKSLEIYQYSKKLIGAIVTHNHPSGGSLSPGDFQSFLLYGIKELRAKCPDGGVFSLKNKGVPTTVDDYKIIKEAVKKRMKPYKEVKEAFYKRLEGDVYLEEIQKRLGDDVEYLFYSAS